MTNQLTQKRLKELLYLDPETFRFTWLVQRQCVRAGSPAGHKTKQGYRKVVVDGKVYFEHRLVWLYVTGAMPSGCIDHIDTVKDNNNIANLRYVTHSENMQNQPHARRLNRAGFVGVRPHGEKYQVDIRIRGVRRTLGTFCTPEEAYEACLSEKAHAGIPIKGARI